MHLSFNVADIISILIAVTALIGLFRVSRSEATTTNTNTNTNLTIDVNDLLRRIDELEQLVDGLREAHRVDREEIAALSARLEEAYAEIERLRELEHDLEETARSRKGEMTKLRNRLTKAEARIKQLEDWIRLNTEYDPETI